MSKAKAKRIKTIDFSKTTYRDWDHIYSPYKLAPNIYKNIIPKNKYQITNTKRTINPEYAPLISFKSPKKKVINLKLYSEEYIKLFQSKKKVEIKSNINNNKNKGKSCTKFKKYKISHILNNDDDNDNIVKNDKKILKKNERFCFIYKLKNDYSSGISCLKNTFNDINRDKKIKRGKTYNKFNTYNNINNNNFKHKRENLLLDRVFNDTKYKNKESHDNFDMMKPSSIFDKKYEMNSFFSNKYKN